MEKDKQQHLLVSGAISGVTYKVMRSNGNSKAKSILYGMALANFVGLMKEYSDPKIDPQDIYVNVVGSILGPSVFIVMEF
jgi:hypothetical protein